MAPRPPTPPPPPPSVIRAMQAPGEPHVEKVDMPLVPRYSKYLSQIKFWKIVGLHYAIVLVLGLSFWKIAAGGPFPHPDVIIKLIGAYCFFIGVIVIPLTIHDILPHFGETDSAFDTTSVTVLDTFDTRLIMALKLSALMLAPLIPLFLAFDPLHGRLLDPLDIMPFGQALLTSSWVFILMEMACTPQDIPGRNLRRLSVVAGFVLLHVTMVGLLAQVSRATLQFLNPLKILIDINPFSQLYILMEGRDQQWLLVNTYSQRLIDYRIYMFIIQLFTYFIALALYRSLLKTRSE